jgi:hypothetical protein
MGISGIIYLGLAAAYFDAAACSFLEYRHHRAFREFAISAFYMSLAILFYLH